MVVVWYYDVYWCGWFVVEVVEVVEDFWIVEVVIGFVWFEWVD